MYNFDSNIVDCKICNSLIPLQHFQLHLKTKHEITFLEYIGKVNKLNPIIKGLEYDKKACRRNTKKERK